MSDIFKNREGYADRTAGLAVRNADNDQKMLNKKREIEALRFIKGAKQILKDSGFELLERIKIKDMVTGKEYR